MKTSDQNAIVLANKIRECIAKHMQNFNATEYQEMLASAIIALYIETARVKVLSVQTGEVLPEDFDKVFMKGLIKHYEDSKEKHRSH